MKKIQHEPMVNNSLLKEQMTRDMIMYHAEGAHHKRFVRNESIDNILQKKFRKQAMYVNIAKMRKEVIQSTPETENYLRKRIKHPQARPAYIYDKELLYPKMDKVHINFG